MSFNRYFSVLKRFKCRSFFIISFAIILVVPDKIIAFRIAHKNHNKAKSQQHTSHQSPRNFLTTSPTTSRINQDPQSYLLYPSVQASPLRLSSQPNSQLGLTGSQYRFGNMNSLTLSDQPGSSNSGSSEGSEDSAQHISFHPLRQTQSNELEPKPNKTPNSKHSPRKYMDQFSNNDYPDFTDSDDKTFDARDINYQNHEAPHDVQEPHYPPEFFKQKIHSADASKSKPEEEWSSYKPSRSREEYAKNVDLALSRKTKADPALMHSIIFQAYDLNGEFSVEIIPNQIESIFKDKEILIMTLQK